MTAKITETLKTALAGIALYILLQQVGVIKAIPFPFSISFGDSTYDLAPPAAAETPKHHK